MRLISALFFTLCSLTNLSAAPDNILSVVHGDFRIPYYGHCRQADLMLYLDEEAGEPLPVYVTLYDPAGEKVLQRVELNLQSGENRCALHIATLASGRYPVSIKAQDARVPGELKRLLRIDNGFSASPLRPGADVSGKKLFLMDDYHVEMRVGVSVEVNPGKAHFATWLDLVPGLSHWLPQVRTLLLTEERKAVIRYQDAEGDAFKWRYAITDDLAGLNNWSIHDGIPSFKYLPQLKRKRTPQATPKWSQKVPDEKAVFRFYDAERDGIPPLNEIHVKFTGVEKKDFSGSPIPYRSTYAVWEKTPGEILFLSREPLCQDRSLRKSDGFEGEIDTNDNFGGQHLSEDGKTLVYIVGRVVRRFPPLNVPYDNLPYASRMLTAFYTHDGFNWKKKFILPQSENDPVALQQYGVRIFKDPDSDIYWGYLLSYHCVQQQIGIDVIYSRDLLNWTRPGDKPFLANSEIPGDWLFGRVMGITEALYRMGNIQYHSMNSVFSSPHFYEKKDNDPESFKRRFGHRKVEEWPFFDKFGSYEALCADMRKAWSHRALGVFTSRPDGAIALTAKDIPGILVTRAVRAGSGLQLNARTGADGYVKVELLDNNNKIIKGYSRVFRGDKVDAPIFGGLPEKEFKVRLTVEKAQVFALSF
ncbi:MAG: hypothetical protein PF904_07565 [Kiritimatiellae bacterium]|jgi:hypothetical protein|nr:hypothetical protein [Kiritimatiellia bacterium]